MTVYEFIRDIVMSGDLCIIVDGEEKFAVIKDSEKFHQNNMSIALAEKTVKEEVISKVGINKDIILSTVYVE